MGDPFRNRKELIALLAGRMPHYRELLSFYEKIYELQSRAEPRLSIKLPKQELRDIGVREGFPLLSRGEFALDVSEASALFESLCTAIKHANETIETTIEILEGAFSISALRREELLRHHADDAYLDGIARDFDVESGVLRFLIHASILPSLRSHAEAIKKHLDLEKWLRGYCPICGSSPLIALLSGEGRRSFICSFCGTEWPGERLKCPHCETTDHTKLHYFCAEEDEGHRVDVCDNCNRYIKTVDCRKLDYEPDPILEDVTTIHLDILATEKGFLRLSSPSFRR